MKKIVLSVVSLVVVISLVINGVMWSRLHDHTRRMKSSTTLVVDRWKSLQSQQLQTNNHVGSDFDIQQLQTDEGHILVQFNPSLGLSPREKYSSASIYLYQLAWQIPIVETYFPAPARNTDAIKVLPVRLVKVASDFANYKHVSEAKLQKETKYIQQTLGILDKKSFPNGTIIESTLPKALAETAAVPYPFKG